MSASNQIRAADPALSVFVTANAGSGKTTTLVNRVARLLLNGVAPGEVLCVTYTKAAAAEMQSRLFTQLGGWAVADDRTLTDQIAALDASDPSALDAAALSRARRLFARALETPGGLKIQTIHAFCEKLLRRFPLEAGVSPRFTVLEDQAAIALSHAAREDLARAALADPDGPIGMAYSHFAVALDWGAFQSLLAMIETERAKLTDYIERVETGAAPGPHAVAGADPDATPQSIEDDFLDWIDGTEWEDAAEAMATSSPTDQKLAQSMRAVRPGDAHTGWSVAAMGPVFLTGAGAPRARMATRTAPPAAAEFLIDLQLKYLAVLDRLRAAALAEDTIRVLTLARAHAGLYEAAKTRRGALDFPDLVWRASALLTRAGAAAWVLYKLDGGIEHVLIDEAQDTAPEQWAIVRALTGEFFSGAGARAGSASARTIFAVGDEKQSIYSFQGARPERLRQEAQAYQTLVDGAGAAFSEVPLDVSYRSTPQVLAFVDVLFQLPERARALVGATGEISVHHPIRADQHGSIDLVPLFVDEPAPERDAWDDPVDQEAASSARKRLAARLAQDIRDQVRSGVAVHDKANGALRPCTFGDFLVLVRRRDATFEEIIRALKAAGVPVAGADRLKLSSHIVFDDLIALARFALFPEDDLSLAEVLRSPFCDIEDFGPPDSLYALAGREKRAGLWRELRDRADEHPAWRRALDLAVFVVETRERDPFAFFSSVLNRIDATGRSGRARILVRLGAEAEEAIDETLNQVLAAEDRGASDLETCVAALEAADVEVKRELEGSRDQVRVMTVHGAKGLEAPIVILPDTTMRARAQGPALMPVETDQGQAWLMCPGAAKDDCPASAAARAARQARTDDETLRLLYVALTRARDRIVVMGRVNTKGQAQDGSWWSVIQETFDRLDAQVRTLDDGLRRYGAEPQALPRPGAAAAAETSLPDWTARPPAFDPSARYASPSRMEGSIRIAAPSPLSVSAGPGAALGRFRRGDLIHRLLERLPDLPTGDRVDAAARMLARERDLDDDQRAEMAAAALSVLDDARFAPVFGEGSRAEVALTGSAPELPTGVAISGRIDRLVITPERVLVVDYKTNRPAPDRIENADPAYVLQLAIYAAVLRRLYPDRPVGAALVWTDGPKLMPVPDALLRQALESAR